MHYGEQLRRLTAHPGENISATESVGRTLFATSIEMCGQTSHGLEIHDHVPEFMQSDDVSLQNGKYVRKFAQLDVKPYNPKTDGEIGRWLKEGEEVKYAGLKPGYIAVHEHNGKSLVGAVEFTVYKRSEYKKMKKRKNTTKPLDPVGVTE